MVSARTVQTKPRDKPVMAKRAGATRHWGMSTSALLVVVAVLPSSRARL